ncbi:single-stranded DNA-binding protein [Finegoldia sp. BIOML-A3]|uniref:single-stranded DNA-binding protein n=1 Tax=unclassified Finegoldia TaxID=2619637 RepID=UPI0012AFFADE|nr:MULTISPECIES: single-stranded DNA-binding protein [unclassified Finegoldia]MSA99649.1 single-stranded DNA-binding protein [Finegoldia sp. BIOML-A3]MSB93635.1 single-stranded DNA-binding protein [Finegoldia sp. BIOML-A4]
MNNVSLMGRLTRDVDLRMTNSNLAVGRFNVAVDRKLSKEKRQEAEKNNQPTADFIGCIAFGKMAENIATYFRKGQRIAVSGHIQTGSYEKDGQRIYTTDVVVDSFDFVESNSSSTNNNQGYSNPADLGMTGAESFDSDLPF